jgi:4-diphosphocytidyl-2-C-methyl-D-erythritol kinase
VAPARRRARGDLTLSAPVRELAFAKANLVLQVGPPRGGGLHPVCSLLASLDLADELSVRRAADATDVVSCPGVEGENLAERALAALRARLGDDLPPLAVDIEKRIPVAAGLGGGSADAAAVLRAANALADGALGASALREIGIGLGSDVPSQVEPRHVLLTGVGDGVEPVTLPSMVLVLVPNAEGLLTADVYAEFDRLGLGREQLDPGALRRLAKGSLGDIAAAVGNDLEPAALSLRPELQGTLDALRDRGALAAAISGSGPTAFGVFGELEQAERAAAAIEGAIVTRTRDNDA